MAKQENNLELGKIRSILVGSTKGYTVTEISRRIGTNRNSVAKYLDILVASGTVEMKTVGSAKLFTLSKRMPIASIINVSSDYILLLDEDFRVTFANENMLRFEKKTLEEITEKEIGSLELTKAAGPEIRTLLEESIKGQERSVDLECRTGSDHRAFHARFVPGTLENTRKGLIVILSAIREKEVPQGIPAGAGSDQPAIDGTPVPASGAGMRPVATGSKGSGPGEKIFREYTELTRQGIWAIDETAKTTFINRRAAEILGYTTEEMTGRSLYTFLDNTEKGLIEKTLATLAKDRINREETDLEFTRKDGRTIRTTVSLAPSFSDSGIFTGALLVIDDRSAPGEPGTAPLMNEEYYRTIIEAMPGGVVIFDTPGTIRMANRQTGKFLGFPAAKELDGKNIFNFITPDDTEKCQESLATVTGTRETSSFECRFIRKDNTGFCGDMSVSLLRGDTAAHDVFVGIVSDITGRRRAEALLKSSESKYRALVEGLSYSIFTADTGGRITYISPVITRILGYLPEELTGKHFYALVSPDSRHELGVKLKESTLSESTPFDYQMTDKSGHLRWVRIIARPQKEGGEVKGINGLIGDIDEWKLTENAFNECSTKYKTVVEDQTDLICRFSPDMRIRFVNPAFCRFFEKIEDDLLDKNLGDLIPGPGRSSLATAINHITGEFPVKPFEMDITSSSGIPLSYHVTARGIFSPQGKKTEFQISCRDITEMKSYFERSQKLLQQLQVQQTEMGTRDEELRRLETLAEIASTKFQDFFETIPVGSLTLDERGSILEVNRSASQLMGKAQENLVAGALGDFVAGKSLPAYTEFLRGIFTSNEKRSCEITLVRDGSAPFTALLIGKAIMTPPGRPRQCSTVIIDTNEVAKKDKIRREPSGIPGASRKDSRTEASG